MEWKFLPADAAWLNGTSEALVKSVKKVIMVAVGESVVTFSESQTVFFEAASLVNEGSIGRHPTSPEDGTYLCPKDLLLGWSTCRVPNGPFREKKPKSPLQVCSADCTHFWRK